MDGWIADRYAHVKENRSTSTITKKKMKNTAKEDQKVKRNKAKQDYRHLREM